MIVVSLKFKTSFLREKVNNPITNSQSPITNSQSPITNHQSPINN
ncbi:hypothetical protein [Sphaerospermopsis sp. FACHB-1094]|nr:hypothetical protein [Sphaerospermopsis sp. FACHB-1094]